MSLVMCEVVIYEVVIVICGDLSDDGGKRGRGGVLLLLREGVFTTSAKPESFDIDR
jgi:hypothetical protein